MIIKFGLIVFMCIAGGAFWVLLLMSSVIPGWIGLNLKEYVEENILKTKDPFEGRS
jgi:hypothetical protein